MFIWFHFPRVVSCRSVWHSGSTPIVINTILGDYAYFWIFWRGFFEARKKGSRLEFAGSQNSFPVCKVPKTIPTLSMNTLVNIPVNPCAVWITVKFLYISLTLAYLIILRVNYLTASFSIRGSSQKNRKVIYCLPTPPEYVDRYELTFSWQELTLFLK